MNREGDSAEARTEKRFSECCKKIDDVTRDIETLDGEIVGAFRSLKQDCQLTRRVIIASVVGALIAGAALFWVIQMRIGAQIEAIREIGIR